MELLLLDIITTKPGGNTITKAPGPDENTITKRARITFKSPAQLPLSEVQITFKKPAQLTFTITITFTFTFIFTIKAGLVYSYEATICYLVDVCIYSLRGHKLLPRIQKPHCYTLLRGNKLFPRTDI